MRTPAVLIWLAIFAGVLLWSAIGPADCFTWMLEVAPALIALCILAATWRRFRFTPLAYWLILLQAIILMVGGHYTYAKVPLFDWLNEIWALGRNDYDKFAHFAQGFVPAIVAREILLRLSPLTRGAWLFSLVVCVCLAISAAYELVEWWVALATGFAAEAFLGTQGDVWDTQSDMAMALGGAIVSLWMLGSWHDRQLAKVDARD